MLFFFVTTNILEQKRAEKKVFNTKRWNQMTGSKTRITSKTVPVSLSPMIFYLFQRSDFFSPFEQRVEKKFGRSKYIDVVTIHIVFIISPPKCEIWSKCDLNVDNERVNWAHFQFEQWKWQKRILKVSIKIDCGLMAQRVKSST